VKNRQRAHEESKARAKAIGPLWAEKEVEEEEEEE